MEKLAFIFNALCFRRLDMKLENLNSSHCPSVSNFTESNSELPNSKHDPLQMLSFSKVSYWTIKVSSKCP